MILFFDIDTTQTANIESRLYQTIDINPRIVQIAWLLYNNEKELVESKSYIVRPSGFSIEKHDSDRHKISNELALAKGKDIVFVLNEFINASDSADYIVTFNLEVVEEIICSELLLSSVKTNFLKKKKISLMELALNMPNSFNYSKTLRNVKVSTLYYNLFGFDFNDYFNANSNVGAISDCFWELSRKEIIDLRSNTIENERLFHSKVQNILEIGTYSKVFRITKNNNRKIINYIEDIIFQGDYFILYEKVKSIEIQNLDSSNNLSRPITKYFFDENGQISKVIAKNSEYIFHYNKSGNIISIQNKKYVNNLFKEFKYNKRGMLIESILFDTYGSIFTKINYEYNNNDFIIKSTHFYFQDDEQVNTKLEYEYDNLGRLINIEEEDDDHTSKFFRLVNYEYNLEGGISKKINTIGEYFEETYEYEYNLQGEIVTENYTENNELNYRTTIIKRRYNDEGFILNEEGIVYDNAENNGIRKKDEFHGHIQSRFSKDFLLDSKGNWIQLTEKKDNEPTVFTKRIIEYY